MMNPEWKPPSISVSTPTNPRRIFERKPLPPIMLLMEIAPLVITLAAELKQIIIMIDEISPPTDAMITGSLLLLQIDHTIIKIAIRRHMAKNTAKAMSLPLMGSNALGQVKGSDELPNIPE